MIDIESLDTTPDCVILTIGAVRFDPKGMGVVEKLELRPTIDEQTEKYGRILADVYLGELHLNKWMIDQSFGVAYDGKTKQAPLYWIE